MLLYSNFFFYINITANHFKNIEKVGEKNMTNITSHRRLLFQFEQFFWGKMRIKEVLHSSPLLSENEGQNQLVQEIFNDTKNSNLYKDILKFFKTEKRKVQEEILDRSKFVP